MSDALPGKVYQWPDGLRELLDYERETYIIEMWRRYQATQDKNGNAGDYILLAEICAAALSGNDPAIAKEVVRILAKHNPSKAGRISQREKEQILRLWDNFRKNNPTESYDSIEFREVVSEIMGGSTRYSIERIRGIIRERDKKLEKRG